MNRFLFQLLLFAGLLASGCAPGGENRIVIGSKNFTEQVVLGELVAQHLENRTALEVDRRFYLGGSYVCHQGMLAGRLDLYVEYTGTALTAILEKKPQGDAGDVYERVKQAYAKEFDLVVTEPLGFENTFALIVRGETARQHDLETISDLAAHAGEWRPGFGYEFMERPDGYRGLIRTYNLEFGEKPRTMDLGLLYKALQEGQVDLIVANSTDGLIQALDLKVLEDDKGYFPPYEAVPVVRRETLARHSGIRRVLDELAGRITASEMRRMNFQVDGEHRDVKAVARDFLRAEGLL